MAPTALDGWPVAASTFGAVRCGISRPRRLACCGIGRSRRLAFVWAKYVLLARA